MADFKTANIDFFPHTQHSLSYRCVRTWKSLPAPVTGWIYNKSLEDRELQVRERVRERESERERERERG